MVVRSWAAAAGVLLYGSELGMRVAGLYRTHHADHEDACNRNRA
jgi:hypothetical protein